MAIRHMVIFEADETAPEEDVKRAFDEAAALLEAIPGVRSLLSGLGADPKAEKRRYGIIMDFDSLAAIDAYIAHENHEAALTVIRPYNKAAMNVQLEI